MVGPSTPHHLDLHDFKVYRLGTVNSNTVNSKFHLIRSLCEMFSYHFMFKMHGYFEHGEVQGF